jgi:hypothetical protein
MANAGKSALVAAGAGFGLLRGLRVLGNINRNAARLARIQTRIDAIHVVVARLADQTEQLQVKLDQRVTHDELAETINRVFKQLEHSVETRFEHQNRSTEALRVMVGQTDDLLQRVLDGLAAVKAEREEGVEEAGRRWGPTQMSH